jgi:hypothetical protein
MQGRVEMRHSDLSRHGDLFAEYTAGVLVHKLLQPNDITLMTSREST